MRRLMGLLLASTLVAQAAEDQISAYRRGLYRSPEVAPVSFGDSPRITSLIRAGNLYISLQDAIALAIENNLDVQWDRLNTPISQSDTLRAKGGGTLRGISTTVSEVPEGIGGPNAPLITAAATGTTSSSTLPGYSSDLALITEAQTASSLTPSTLFAAGPPIPAYDPAIVGQVNYARDSTPQLDLLSAGVPNLTERNVTADVGYQQGFSPGTQINTYFDNNFIKTNALNTFYNPYATSNLGLSVTQPLLRGFGTAVNRRFIRIAKNNEKVSDLVFKQQLIDTVSGVIRLYQDLVALNEDVVNRRETLSLAQRLYEDNKNKVDVGTLAPVELTRAQAQVAAARQDLINAEGFVRQQELILLSVLTRRFTADPILHAVRVIPTDPLITPGDTSLPPASDLINAANANRPDLLYTGIQIDNSNIALEGSRNELRPEVDLVGTYQQTGLAGAANSSYTSVLAEALPPTLAYQGNYGTVLNQIVHQTFPTFTVGVNLTIPLRNRVAQADVIRDELQLRQNEIRRQQLINQVRLEVEDALVALQRARDSYDAAVEVRKLQEQSLAIEQERYGVGLSTTFLVLQYQSYLAQARTTEIAAKGIYAKAKTALDRAVGTTLTQNNVSVAESYAGRVQH